MITNCVQNLPPISYKVQGEQLHAARCVPCDACFWDDFGKPVFDIIQLLGIGGMSQSLVYMLLCISDALLLEDAHCGLC